MKLTPRNIVAIVLAFLVVVVDSVSYFLSMAGDLILVSLLVIVLTFKFDLKADDEVKPT